MLGKYGETLVVDWGLAKAVGEPEHASERRPSGRSAVASVSRQRQLRDAGRLGASARRST